MEVGHSAADGQSHVSSPALERKEAHELAALVQHADFHVAAHRCHRLGEFGAKVGAVQRRLVARDSVPRRDMLGRQLGGGNDVDVHGNANNCTTPVPAIRVTKFAPAMPLSRQALTMQATSTQRVKAKPGSPVAR